MGRSALSANMFICAAAAFMIFSMIGVPNASAVTQVVFQEDFESTFPGSWSVGDADSASGLDYWGTTNYRVHQGSYSAWCAQVGTYSGNGQPNSANHYYDQDMWAYMVIYIGDLSQFDAVSISFYYWAVTGTFSLADYLSFLTSPDGATYTVRWSQPDVTSSGWQLVTLAVPLDTTYVYFRFISDPTVGLGPYEGAYVDDIVMTASDSQAPTSSVGSIPMYQTAASFSISYVAADLGGSGLAYVELYYRHGTSGAFSLYTTTGNPSGHWTASPITFDSSALGGDGTYQFYTRATDEFGNHEGTPGSPDASTVVDTVAPSTTHGVVGTLGSLGWYTSSVSVTLVSSDVTSGIASTLYQLDSGSWQTYSSSFSLTSDGNHLLEFYSTDNAGNSEAQKSVSIKIDTSVPTSTSILIGTMGTNDWHTRDFVTINLTAFDSASGVSSIQYRINNGNWQAYASEFAISQQGTTSLDYYASDVAGNVETQKSVSFKLDSASPILDFVTENGTVFTSSDASIAWSSSDETSGLDRIEFSLDGSAFQSLGNTTTVSLEGLADGSHSIIVRSTDKAGNTVEKALAFEINTNVFSLNGPMGPWLDVSLVIAVLAVVGVLIYVMRRRRSKVEAKPPEQPSG